LVHIDRSLSELLAEIAACRVCEAHLPLGPRPIVRAGSGAQVVVIGQAPGRRVHVTGIPWDDPSGSRLRAWLGVPRETFYDPERIALVPMGFCYPGPGRSGDRPPRPECAPLWHPPLLAELRHVELTLVIGTYARARYLPAADASLTDAVRGWRELLPTRLVLPHPSPRNQRWLVTNPWFEAEVVPALRGRLAEIGITTPRE
jgi:uracil-DNA glycosylase